MDYGHPLEFGTFVTPVNNPAAQPVALAQLSEQLGFDLVTFQDHPYQAAFHDTWTLLTWVAASTERIRVAANVHNLPLRPPAVLARAAASLDLLSGGRFDLGLGAGGFWDAIEGMGGERRTPAEAVQAFDEALDVIRGLWAADERAPLRVPGKFHRVNGAKRGPAPAHNIPIWVGAVGPRMLRLLARKGDGWLPSLAYVPPAQLREGNAVIDAEAERVGRDPREIRRLLNVGGRFSTRRGGMLDGPAEQWVEELTALALKDGVATFIIVGDDPSTVQRFAEEVAPAVREAVDRERGGAAGGGSVLRSATVRARRRDGIDYEGIPAGLSAIEPGDAQYARVRSTYMRGGRPGLVLQPRTPDEVREALAFARRNPSVPLAIRSGGHGISGRSTNDGGIVIDLGRLNAIDVLDEATRRVRLEPGARWMDVAARLSEHGWALSSGDYGGVGVGGLATAGGIGWLVREHGLTIDHLRAVELILADGSLVRATEEENVDLFWAVRGAGANFGIVVAFEFEVDEVGDVGFAQLVFDATDTADFLEKWGAAVEASPRDTTSFLILGRPRPGQPVTAQALTVVDSDDPDTVIERLQRIADAGPVLGQSAQILPYASIMANAQGGDHDGQGDPAARSGLLDHVTTEFAQEAARLLESGVTYFFQLRSVGGAVADVPADATAYANRSANFSVVAFGADSDRLNHAWESMHPHFTGLYLSFETDQRVERLDEAFPGGTMRRLRELKRRYDPDNVFRDNFNIVAPEVDG